MAEELYQLRRIGEVKKYEKSSIIEISSESHKEVLYKTIILMGEVILNKWKPKPM